MDYETATVKTKQKNNEKTQGLWVGSWKNRTDDPFQEIDAHETKRIKWTNKNVECLGIYVGNERPDIPTFEMMVPK